MIDLTIFKMGFFILVKNDNSWIGNRIRNRQIANGIIPEHADYTHIDISGGEKHAIRVAPPRAKLIDIIKVYKGRYIKLMAYKDPIYSSSKRYKVAYFSATLNNLGYDFKGVLSFIFKWIKQSNRLYFCSEAAAQSLQRVFPKALYRRKPSNIMPADFLNPIEFETIFEGYV